MSQVVETVVAVAAVASGVGALGLLGPGVIGAAEGGGLVSELIGGASLVGGALTLVGQATGNKGLERVGQVSMAAAGVGQLAESAGLLDPASKSLTDIASAPADASSLADPASQALSNSDGLTSTASPLSQTGGTGGLTESANLDSMPGNSAASINGGMGTTGQPGMTADAGAAGTPAGTTIDPTTGQAQATVSGAATVGSINGNPSATMNPLSQAGSDGTPVGMRSAVTDPAAYSQESPSTLGMIWKAIKGASPTQQLIGAKALGGALSYIAPSPLERAQIAQAMNSTNALNYDMQQRAAYNKSLIGSGPATYRPPVAGTSPVSPGGGVTAPTAAQLTLAPQPVMPPNGLINGARG